MPTSGVLNVTSTGETMSNAVPLTDIQAVGDHQSRKRTKHVVRYDEVRTSVYSVNHDEQ